MRCSIYNCGENAEYFSRASGYYLCLKHYGNIIEKQEDIHFRRAYERLNGVKIDETNITSK